jgi:hypothetical protein
LRGIGLSKQSIIPRGYNEPTLEGMKKTNITTQSKERGNSYE